MEEVVLAFSINTCKPSSAQNQHLWHRPLGPSWIEQRFLVESKTLRETPIYSTKEGLDFTAAAFYHHIIQKDSLKFSLFSTGLYGQGISFLGNLKVSPGDDLRNTDFNVLANNFANMPPQADWMLMSALRDSENWFFDFEGAPDEGTAFSTSAKEMSKWSEKTGFYSSVVYSDDTSLAAIKTILKKPNNHIALWISVALLGDARSATHMITLESPMVIDGKQQSWFRLLDMGPTGKESRYNSGCPKGQL